MSGTADLEIHDSLVAGNHGITGAGGIRIIYAGTNFLISGCTITDNEGDFATGGLGLVGPAPVRVSNTILYGNRVLGVDDDYEGEIELIGPALFGAVDPLECQLVGDLSGLIEGVDPDLEPLGPHGGPTPSRPPRSRSPVIDAGSELLPGTDPGACSWYDQRGFPRPAGLACDIGSVEHCADPGGLDSDGDGVLDACDKCPNVADDQSDLDGDGLGDACDLECGDEPSALDRDPGAAPLRVSRSRARAGWLELSWQVEERALVELRAYHEIVVGSLGALWEDRYDHAGFGACGLPRGEIAFPAPRRDSYFLVVGSCSGQLSSAGRDSLGRERPEPLEACR